MRGEARRTYVAGTVPRQGRQGRLDTKMAAKRGRGREEEDLDRIVTGIVVTTGAVAIVTGPGRIYILNRDLFGVGGGGSHGIPPPPPPPPPPPRGVPPSDLLSPSENLMYMYNIADCDK